MDDLIKNFLEREREEIVQHKARFGAMIVCAFFAIVFFVSDFGEEEEIISTEPVPVEETSEPVEVEKKSAPKVQKISEVQKVPESNVTAVLGANSEFLFVKDPFNIAEVEEVEEVAEVEENISAENISAQTFQPAPQNNSPPPTSEEKFVLSGTAISDNQRTALVQHYKDKKFVGTIILQVGDTLKGKKVIAIAEDFVTLEGGEKISIY